MDQMYKRALEFNSRFNKLNGTIGFSNMYVVQTIDENGNITSEHYGHNLMTNNGFNSFLGTNAGFPTGFYIGNGSGQETVTMTSLISPITTAGATVSDQRKVYTYPLYYDSTTGIITTMMRHMICYFDYSITDVSGDVVITEYGIGTASNALWTHSWVYDNLGVKSSIVKHPNERLMITVYLTMSYNESMIQNSWLDGKHMVITTMERFMNKFTEAIYTFKRNGKYTQRPGNVVTNIADNVYERYWNLTTFVLTSNVEDANEYIDGFVNLSSGFMLSERELNPTAEAIDTIQNPQNAYILKNDCITNNFGYQGLLPVTSMNIQKIYSFNYSTGQFDTEEEFTASANKWYDETLLHAPFSCPIYVTNNNDILTFYVYTNINTQDPITAFNTSVGNIYATDKYWDHDTWELITDLTSVTPSLQNKRYYILSTNNATDANHTIIRGSIGLQIKPYRSNLYPTTLGYSTLKTSIGMIYSDNTSNIFTIGNMVYRNTDYITRQFNTNESVLSNVTYGFGSMVVNAYNNVLSYVNMSENSPEIHTIQSPHPGISNLVNTMSTESKTGFVIFTSGQNSLKVDFRNNTCVTNTISGSCVAMMYSDYYVRIYNNRFYVKSLIDDSNITNIGYSGSPLFVFGFRNLIYYSNNSSFTRVCDITNGQTYDCDNVIKFTSLNIIYLRFTATEDCLVIYNMYDTGSQDVCIMYDDPTSVHYIPTHNLGSYAQYKISTVKSWRNTFILVTNYNNWRNGGTSTYTCDIGRCISTGENVYNVFDNTYPIIPFGSDNIINGNQMLLLSNALSLRITGTTNTVTAINSYKGISGKQWKLEVSNTTTVIAPTWKSNTYYEDDSHTTVTTSKPSDWETNYSNYYMYNGTPVVGVNVSFNGIPPGTKN